MPVSVSTARRVFPDALRALVRNAPSDCRDVMLLIIASVAKDIKQTTKDDLYQMVIRYSASIGVGKGVFPPLLSRCVVGLNLLICPHDWCRSDSK